MKGYKVVVNREIGQPEDEVVCFKMHERQAFGRANTPMVFDEETVEGLRAMKLDISITETIEVD